MPAGRLPALIDYLRDEKRAAPQNLMQKEDQRFLSLKMTSSGGQSTKPVDPSGTLYAWLGCVFYWSSLRIRTSFELLNATELVPSPSRWSTRAPEGVRQRRAQRIAGDFRVNVCISRDSRADSCSSVPN